MMTSNHDTTSWQDDDAQGRARQRLALTVMGIGLVMGLAALVYTTVAPLFAQIAAALS